MDQNQTPGAESTLSPGKLIGQLVAAVILAEGIWGFLASLTSNLLMPLLARVMDTDPQSPLYLGKGDLNIPPLFNSGLALCLAGIVFVVLYQVSRRKPTVRRVKVVRVTRKVAQQPAAGSLSIAGPLSITATPEAAPSPPAVTPQVAAPVSVPPATAQSKPAPSPVAAQAKPSKPKEVYYNLVGDPINPTEDD
ncbi:MAG: hypothetical protein WB952_26065 [Terriglobales bacterium]